MRGAELRQQCRQVVFCFIQSPLHCYLTCHVILPHAVQMSSLFLFVFIKLSCIKPEILLLWYLILNLNCSKIISEGSIWVNVSRRLESVFLSVYSSKRQRHACVCLIVRNKADSQPTRQHPVMEFLVFAPFPNTSFWADCILGNGKPQTCDHPSVLMLHIGQELTHIYTHSHLQPHTVPIIWAWVHSSSAAQSWPRLLWQLYYIFTTVLFSHLITSINEPPPWRGSELQPCWQAVCWPTLNRSSCTVNQISGEGQEEGKVWTSTCF